MSKERALSVVGFLIAVAGLLGLFYTGNLLAGGPLLIAVQVGAVLLMIWARVTFGMRSFHLEAHPTQGGLVTTGPYRFVRHPIYAAALYFTAAAVLAHPSALSLALGLVVAAGLALRIACEERLVRQMYPEYEDYARRVRRVIPYVL